MRSREQLLSEAKAAQKQGKVAIATWYGTLTDDERAVFWEMAEGAIQAAQRVVEIFQEWLEKPLTHMRQLVADWYDSLPTETRAMLEAMGDPQTDR